ncbi:MAG: UTP--glucose-1-phosphate uridylyltransferase [Kiritimatiellia bacterium]|jgi:UDP-N-acetylglucosamine/UDP-N-acetylgalactosamine diphosphorylase
MRYEDAVKILSENDQSHLLKFWDRLDETQRQSLLGQIADLDFTALAEMRKALAAHLTPKTAKTLGEITPAPVAVLEGEAADAAARIGSFEIRNRRVAALVVAGGQGSRLGYEGPKGCFPIGPISQESLFFFHARKILALGREWGAAIPFYVMTSTENDAPTRAFFKENNYFGLDKDDVFFFTQAMWPALDADGRIILDRPDRIFLGPDGHGGTFAALERSGGLADMVKRGITSVFYFQVDNPLVDVADPVFVGFHKQRNADISLKVCAKRNADEGLGVVVERDGKVEIVEYTEFPPAQKSERLPDGDLRFKYGSVAIHVFDLDFLRREAQSGLPIHVAFKKVPFVDDDGDTVKPEAPNAYKFEKFIFDSLADAKISVCLAFDRADEFAPVKNATGNDSPATCQAALMAKWARWLRTCGVNVAVDENGVPAVKVEIDPAFAHSAAALRKRLTAENITIDPTKDILLQ